MHSDTDILGISDDCLIEKTYNDLGISFHVYPMTWMVENARSGSLFLLHIVNEAVPIYDPYQCLNRLYKEFKYKNNYAREIESGIRIVSAVAELNAENFSFNMRSRYFWGLRTALMAASADLRKPIFASEMLEEFSQVEGLADHIHSRLSTPLHECRLFGLKVIQSLRRLAPEIVIDTSLNNCDVLLSYGGVAAATAGEIIYRG